MEAKKEQAIELLKKIFQALHEKRFGDIAKLVDTCTLDAQDIEECVQGTVEMNEFETMDTYREENICSIHERESSAFEVDSYDSALEVDCYITADGGNELPLVLSLRLENWADGSVRTHLDMEPN
ncbi:MAG: hypothetical protein HFI75_12800 [Lachnospiraceae bacterium]|nr:hypothetical protein [Lachnospiraceae bacterium]